MTAEYVKPKNGLDGELVCSNCGAHPISKNGNWVITRHCHECGARIIGKDHPWYEEERSRILYTCEEKYDGNMVAFVIDLESQLKNVQAERDALLATVPRACGTCKHFLDKPIVTENEHGIISCYCENDKCYHISGVNTGWEWRGIPDEKGSDQT